jgi:Alginate export
VKSRFACIFCFALAPLAAQQTPATNFFAPSDELNKALPQWLRFSGEYRARMEGFSGGGFRPDNDDLYLLNRFRVNMAVKPTSWLKFQFQGQDARVFGKNHRPAAPPFQDVMDLRMAYVEIGEPESKTAGLRVGRQELVFGEQRLVGHVSWLNTARTFDAVRATFRHQGYRLDAFAASVVNLRDGEFNRRADGNNFHGLYGGIEKLVPRAVIEPYLFWRLAPGLLTEVGTRGKLNSKTIGFRWVGKLPANFDYGAEVAGQTGSLGTDSVGAWAGHWLLGYTTASLPYRPRFIAEYNYASGDSEPGNGKRGTFDQLYPTPHDKYGLADQIGWRNIHHARAGIEFKPRPKWTIASNYHSFWLASATDALYAASGAAVARSIAGTAGTHVGQELDAQAMYVLSRQLQIGGGYAHLFTGRFLKLTTPGESYSYPYVMLGYMF